MSERPIELESAMAIAIGPGTRVWAASNCGFRVRGTAATIRLYSSRAAEVTRIGGCRPGSVCARGEHPACGRPCQSARHEWHFEKPGQPVVPGIGHRGRAVPNTQVGRVVCLLLAGCDLSEGEAGAPRGQ